MAQGSPKFISDEDMQKMDGQSVPSGSGGPAQPKSQAKFISDVDMEKMSASQPSKGFSPEAAIQGFGQGALSGYLPELQAGVGKLIPNPTADVDEKLKSQGFSVPDSGPGGVSSLKEARQRDVGLAKESPGSYLAGGVGGAIASSPAYGKALGLIPGLGAVEGAGVGTRLAQAAAGGGVQGFIQNPGETDNQLKSRLSQAKMGAAFGAGTQLVGEAGGKIASGVADAATNLKEYAQEKAVKSAGAMLKDFRRLLGKDRVGELGQSMIDNGLVNPGMTFSDVAAKSSQIKQDVGSKIGEVYDQVRQNISQNPAALNEKLSFVHPDTLQKNLIDIVKDPKVRPKIGTDAYDTQMTKVVSDVLGEGRARETVDKAIQNNPDLFKLSKIAEASPQSAEAATFRNVRDTLVKNTQHANLADPRNLNDMIGEIDDKINWSKRDADLSNQQQGLVAIRRFLRDKVNQVSDAAASLVSGGKEASDQLKQLNKLYGHMSEISTISADRNARETANRLFSPSDYASGLGGAAVGALIGEESGHPVKGAITGAALGLANKGFRRYGNPVLVQGANAAGNALGSIAPATQAIGAAGQALTKNPAQTGAAAARIKGLLK
jgi:hypothetical protein